MKANFVLTLVLLAVCHASIAVAQSPGTFTATGSMLTPRQGHAATLLLNGKVLIIGGVSGTSEDGFGVPAASAELYDPSTGAFTATSIMMNGIYDPSSVASTTGDGVTRQYPGTGATAFLLPDGRVFLGGTLLRDGRVFICRDIRPPNCMTPSPAHSLPPSLTLLPRPPLWEAHAFSRRPGLVDRGREYLLPATM